jgi:hypothetical protein
LPGTPGFSRALIEAGVRPQDAYFLVYLPGHELIAFNITMECIALLLLSPLAFATWQRTQPTKEPVPPHHPRSMK